MINESVFTKENFFFIQNISEKYFCPDPLLFVVRLNCSPHRRDTDTKAPHFD